MTNLRADHFSETEINEPVQLPTTELEIAEWRDGIEGSVVQKLCDQVIEEPPVALVYNGISHAVMMVTPNNLEAFALGFSLSEGVLESPDQLYDITVKRQNRGLEIAMQIRTLCYTQRSTKKYDRPNRLWIMWG